MNATPEDLRERLERRLLAAIRAGDRVAEATVRARLCRGCAFPAACLDCLPTIARSVPAEPC